MISDSDSPGLGSIPSSSANDIPVIYPGSKWRNKKTGDLYTVLMLVNDSEEEAPSKMLRVIYRKPGDGRPWDRPAWLFHQKFEPSGNRGDLTNPIPIR